MSSAAKGSHNLVTFQTAEIATLGDSDIHFKMLAPFDGVLEYIGAFAKSAVSGTRTTRIMVKNGAVDMTLDTTAGDVDETTLIENAALDLSAAIDATTKGTVTGPDATTVDGLPVNRFSAGDTITIETESQSGIGNLSDVVITIGVRRV